MLLHDYELGQIVNSLHIYNSVGFHIAAFNVIAYMLVQFAYSQACLSLILLLVHILPVLLLAVCF